MPRIQISHEAAKALKVAAAIQDKRPHALMEELIMRHCATHALVDIEPSVHMPKEPHILMAAKLTRTDSHEATEPSSQVAICPHENEPQHNENPESRRTSPPEVSAPDGRKAGKGGPPPYEEQHPKEAARILELWAGGKRKGGLSRHTVAKVMREEGTPITAAIVDNVTTRARKKNK